MQLSVVIVNYNVKHFLEQCLYSVQKAVEGRSAEIFVVDNHSTDNSLDYLQPSFPGVQFISNKENTGFAKACNQGLAQATGQYILFLNPDTIVPEDCFRLCMEFFDANPGAGALGIKMLDGGGRFLKESKRSFPSPMTSFFKLIGLARLFPASRIFAKYHLGHLSPDKNHEVDVLAGAFMMVRKNVLDKVGGFDETFFMYGEDVDLSYRIQKAGYANYYFSGSNIIHFKGESTRKGSMNYVRMFYTAMSIFVRKHYGGSKAGIFNFLIHIAIWVRATLTMLTHFILRIGMPLIDIALIMLSFWTMKHFWSTYVKTEVLYENSLLWIAIPAYTILYLIAAFYAGLYDRWYRWLELIRSSVVATIVLLAAYSMLPEKYRFSRGVILFGAILSFILTSLQRWILLKADLLTSIEEKEDPSNTVIVGSAEEYQQVIGILKNAGIQERVLGRVAVIEQERENALGYWDNLRPLINTVPFREIIVCEGQLSWKRIITVMPQIPGRIKFRFHAAGSSSIVGSESKDTSGESLSRENGYKAGKPFNRRMKRLIDITVSLFALLTIPIHLFLVKKPLRFIANIFSVLVAQKTWIGYAGTGKSLPALRPAVIACNAVPVSEKQQLPAESLQMMDYWYARDYEPVNDLHLLRKSYRRLGG